VARRDERESLFFGSWPRTTRLAPLTPGYRRWLARARWAGRLRGPIAYSIFPEQPARTALSRT
jgi:hypothetical protein